MQAIGNDGRWHDWSDLTESEKSSWMDAMTKADRIWDEKKQMSVDHIMTSSELRSDRYNNRHRIM